MIEIRNSYHWTRVRIRANVGDELTPGQIRYARRKLCGISGCTCGGLLGERGPQDVVIVTLGPDRVRIDPRD